MIELTGDHERLKKISDSLREVILKGCTQALMQAGLKGEGDAVKAIRNQVDSLGGRWKPLNEQYRKKKIADGQSEKIYVQTSTYMQSITSNLTKNGRGNLKLVYGVRRIAKDKTGREAANIAVALEFGNSVVPARPLWRPAKKTMLKWMVKERPFQKMIAENLKKL